MSKDKRKTYSDCFLYGSSDNYDKNILDYLLNAKEIIKNKNDDKFFELQYNVKRSQRSAALNKVLLSDRVVLLTRTEKPMPRAFKVFACKDLRKNDGQIRVFIDCTNIIDENYNIKPKDMDTFVSYLLSAFIHLVYYSDMNSKLFTSRLISSGAEMFGTLFNAAIDRLRIGTTEEIREQVNFLAGVYYRVCILGMPHTDNLEKDTLRSTKLQQRDADVLIMKTNAHTFDNINTFVETLAEIFNTKDLTIGAAVTQWTNLYGPATIFALEYAPAYYTMLTNAYIGAYINNQKAIEKFIGKGMVSFSKDIISIAEGMR